MTRRPGLSRMRPAPKQQRGVALAIILILLLVMTLLGLSSLRGTLMEERMSAGSYDRNLSFQSAEAALRFVEEELHAATSPPVYPDAPTADDNIWDLDSACNSTAATTWIPATDLSLPSMQTVPVYAVEKLGPAAPPNDPGCGRDGHPETCEVTYYRITTCSRDLSENDSDGRALTILQSNYTP